MRVVMVPPVALLMARGLCVLVRCEVRPHLVTPAFCLKTQRIEKERPGVSERDMHPGRATCADHLGLEVGRGARATCARLGSGEEAIVLGESSRSLGKGKEICYLPSHRKETRGGWLVSVGPRGTHHAGALRLLAEVVQQRGHVAEALGRIFPARGGSNGRCESPPNCGTPANHSRCSPRSHIKYNNVCEMT